MEGLTETLFEILKSLYNHFGKGCRFKVEIGDLENMASEYMRNMFIQNMRNIQIFGYFRHELSKCFCLREVCTKVCIFSKTHLQKDLKFLTKMGKILIISPLLSGTQINRADVYQK